MLDDKQFNNVDRLEVIDETGRAYVKGLIYGTPVKIKLSLQDDNKTLKIFVDEVTKINNNSVDKPISDRALEWSLGNDTCVSSETMCRFFMGIEQPSFSSEPSDASDRGRCIRLLKLIPEWIPRLNELTKLDKGTISINGAKPIKRSESEHSWTYQIPLVIKEGKL